MNLGRLAVAYHILCRWKNHFLHLLNVQGIMMSGRLKYLLTYLLVCEPSVLMIEFPIENLER